MTSALSPAVANDTVIAPFQLRGGVFTLLVLRLTDPKDPALFKMLADKVAQAPGFYRNAPLVIDLQAMADAPAFNLAELGRRIRQHQFVPVGVQNGTEEQNKAAINAGFSLFPEGREAAINAGGSTPRPNRANDKTAAAPSPSLGPAGQRVVTQPVRSGRQLFVRSGDLVVRASISPGAELLAEGHIHVYGALRGRALAGVNGDASAQIFCHSLEAELVSIAGFYRVREDMPEELIGKPAHVHLDQDRIVIEPLA